MRLAQFVVPVHLVVVGEVVAEVPRHRQVPPDVPGPAGRLLARLGQPVGPELAQRVEHPVARALPQHDRLVDQLDQRVDDVAPLQLDLGADLLGGRQAEGPGENRQPRPQPLLGQRAQPVRPLDRGVQGLVPFQRPRPSAGEHREPVVEPLAELVEGQPAQLHRRQLDRERYPVEAAAETDHVGRVGRGDGEVGHRRGGPQREQLDRVAAVKLDRVRVGHRQRLDREVLLAEGVERLPAGREHGHAGRLGQDRLDQVGARVEQVLAGVQDQQQPLVPQVLEQRVEGGPRVLLGQAEHARDRVRQQQRVAQAGLLDDPHAVGVVAGRLGRRAQRHPGLADAARPDHGHQPAALEHGGNLRQFALPADEVGELILLSASRHCTHHRRIDVLEPRAW